MYYLNSKKDLLGEHDGDAWIAARRIAVLRWGMGAGYISEEEAAELIIPIVEQIKDAYTSFEDFHSHWLACYCYSFFEKDEVNATIDRLVKVMDSARAYIPFEKLAFTGKNADKEHPLESSQLYYTPDETAQKLKTLQTIHTAYNKGSATKESLIELIAEEDDEDVSNLVCNLHLALLQKFYSPQERVEYLESKWNYINSLENKKGTYSFAVSRYTADLISTYSPQKLVDFYKSLPQDFQTDLDIYYYYGVANYFLANLSQNIIERDIYISRAVNVFTQLKRMEYELGELFDGWLNTLESL